MAKTNDRATAAEARDRTGAVTLPALRAFVAVVETGSFSKAAERLGVTQPNVSLQLGALEKACGLRLLHRRKPGLLTDGGRDLFVRARLVLSRLDEFGSSASNLRVLRRGRVSFGLSTPAYAMRLLGRFLAAHPGITITTRLGNTDSLLADLAECRIDIAMMTMTAPPTGLASTRVARQRLFACLPRRHPLARRASVTIAQLAAAPLVMREPGSMTRRMFEAALGPRMREAELRLEVGSREALREAVAAGIGVSAILEGELGDDARLRAVPLAGAVPAAGVYTVCLPESLEIPAVAALMQEAARLER